MPLCAPLSAEELTKELAEAKKGKEPEPAPSKIEQAATKVGGMFS